MVVTAQSEAPHSCLLCPVLGYIRSDLESQVCELKKSGDCFSDCILGVCSLPLPVTITLVLFRLSKTQPSLIRTRFKTDDKASCGVASCTRQMYQVSQVHLNTAMPGRFLGPVSGLWSVWQHLVRSGNANIERILLQRANCSQYSNRKLSICLKIHSISFNQKCSKTRSSPYF